MPVSGREAVNVLACAIVKDLKDPDGLGRIRVTYPHLGDEISAYARLVTLMAGSGRGAFFRPEVDDEVLVGFEFGDPRRPYILGGLWSQADQPPPGANDQPEKNNLRFMRSRSGHVFRFDDTPGAERIDVIDKDEKRRISIESAGEKIVITCEQGDIAISAPSGEVSIDAKSISITAKESIAIKGRRVGINDPQ